MGLREQWLSDMRRKNESMGEPDERDVGTQNIEQFNTMDLFTEGEKYKKIKKDLSVEFGTLLGLEIAKLDKSLFATLKSELTELLKEEREKMKEELKHEVMHEVKEELMKDIGNKLLASFTTKVTTSTQALQDEEEQYDDTDNYESVNLLKGYKNAY